MATDQKIENLLNLALDATQEEREKSLELNVGYDQADRTWDLIVRYSGSLEALRDLGVQVVELRGGYAILTIRESLIPMLASLSQIEYVEKPKRLFFSVSQGKTASCIDTVQLDIPVPGVGEALFGKGILVAVIDSGVDYTHPDFRNPDGSSRISAIWDQSVPGNPPEGYFLGTEYTKEQIDEALETGTALNTRDISGHGTEVLGIAAGNGRASAGTNSGVASQADILVVKLGSPRPDSFPRTTELMQAVDYVYKKAEMWRIPVAVNLSFGNVYGSHNGTGLLETFLAEMAGMGRSVIAVGTGNEGNTAGHVSGRLQMGSGADSRTGNGNGAGMGAQEIEMGVAPGELTVNVQLWKSYADEFDVFLIHPDGQVLGPLQENLGPQRFLTAGTEVLIYYGEPSPYSISQEIYFDFLPRDTYIDSGIWRFRLVSRRITDGRFDMWLPSAAALNVGTRFYRPSVENTLTIPSTSRKIIAVGAYDSRSLVYAPFSGRGEELPENADLAAGLVKPDLVAPGVDILTAAVGGGYTTVTGTSFATPFVTGSAALLMEWGEGGIIRLRQKSREINGYPGWGVPDVPDREFLKSILCTSGSLK